ncbi:MAG: DUF4236 domain-containing protein [Phycisphaerae bacterium]
MFRRVRIAPGLTLNLTKNGASLSAGVRGAHVTVGKNRHTPHGGNSRHRNFLHIPHRFAQRRTYRNPPHSGSALAPRGSIQ